MWGVGNLLCTHACISIQYHTPTSTYTQTIAHNYTHPHTITHTPIYTPIHPHTSAFSSISLPNSLSGAAHAYVIPSLGRCTCSWVCFGCGCGCESGEGEGVGVGVLHACVISMLHTHEHLSIPTATHNVQQITHQYTTEYNILYTI